MIKLFPHYTVDVRDDSLRRLVEVETLPIHRPAYALKTEKGPVGVPVWCQNKQTAEAIFGEETFNKNNSSYFGRTSVFLNHTLPYNGAFIIRLKGEDMKHASNLLELTVDTVSNTFTYATREIDYDGGETLASIAARTSPIFDHVDDGEDDPVEVDDVSNWTKKDLSNSAINVLNTNIPANKRDGVTTIELSQDVTSHLPIIPRSVVVDLVQDTQPLMIKNVLAKVTTLSQVAGSEVVNVTDASTETAGWLLSGDSKLIVNINSDVYDNLNPTVAAKDLGGDNADLYINVPTVTIVIEYVAAPIFVIGDVGLYSGIWTVDGYKYSLPIMAFESTDPGEYGNLLGYTTYSSVSGGSTPSIVGRMDYVEMMRLGTYMYTLGFTKRKAEGSTFNPIRTQYGTDSFDFAGNPDIVDPALGSTVGYDIQVDRNFSNEIPAPVTGKVYGCNIAFAIGLIKAACTENGEESALSIGAIIDRNPDLIDIFSLTTQDEEDNIVDLTIGGTFLTLVGNSDLLSKSKASSFALSGGSNGTLDLGGLPLDNNEIIEAAVSAVWDLDVLDEMKDAPRYPFNTIIDTGYGLNTKKSLIGMLGDRPDVKIVLSPWSGLPQTEANAVLVGSSLMDYIRGYKSSEIYGTGAFQGNMFGQVGILRRNDRYAKELPYTLWYADKMARMHNLTYIKENPEGDTARDEMFREANWTPYDDTQKRLAWNAGMNYCQYLDSRNRHFPMLKSVYEHESSLFVNDSFTNMVVYIKQLAPALWAKYSGRTDSNEVIYAQVLDDLTKRLTHLLNGKADFNLRMYQTAAEALTGFEHHIDIELLDSMGQRIWHIDIIGKRA